MTLEPWKDRHETGGELENNEVPPLEYASPLKRFLHHDIVGSGMLLTAAVAAVLVANLGLYEYYHDFWETHVEIVVGTYELDKSLHHWVNDGLMCIFFFLVGLEIKRQLLAGELASFRRALLPAVAAIGGMIAPALIYTAVNYGGEGSHGWGIPMATDIAFAAGCLALLKKWIPPSLMVFLVALAIVDDLGAVAVIAVFYTERIAFPPLVIGASLILLSFCMGQLGVRRMLPYAVLGIIIWVAFLRSGVHATIAGVLLAFTIPAHARYRTQFFEGRMKELLARFVAAEKEWEKLLPFEKEMRLSREVMVNQRQQSLLRAMNAECHHVEAPLQRLEYNIEPFCVFLVMPVFAFANAGVHIEWAQLGPLIFEPVTLGVILGLVVGKPLGIVLASWIAVRLQWAQLPRGVSWSQIFGVGMLAGIGFTMSLFINELAFVRAPGDHAATLLAEGKIGIFTASLLSASLGLALLAYVSRGNSAQAHIGLSLPPDSVK